MDLESYGRWYDYSQRARRDARSTPTASMRPGIIVRSDDKRRARLNCIAHIPKTIPYKKIHRSKAKLLLIAIEEGRL